MAIRSCPECGYETVSDKAYSCPYCGAIVEDFAPEQFTPAETKKYTALYVLSFLFPVFGVLAYIIFISKQSMHKYRIGKKCLILSIIPFIVLVLIFILSALSIVLYYTTLFSPPSAR